MPAQPTLRRGAPRSTFPAICAKLWRGMDQPGEKRHASRVEIALPCTLRRPIGRPIVAQTKNIGAGGMLISSARPLTIDEPLDFDLANLDISVRGHARVLRHEQVDVYALRFERLPATMASCLQELAAA